MPRLITISVILILILALALGGIWFADRVRDEFVTLIDQAKKSCTLKDAAALLRLTDEMEVLWERRQVVLSFYSRHDELEKMATHITTLRGCAITQAFDNARITLEQMDFLAEHIHYREIPNLNNLL